VGEGGIAIAGGMPIFQSFYQMFVRNGLKSYKSKDKSVGLVNLKTLELLPWFMREVGLTGGCVVSAITAEARASFYTSYGVTPCEQILLEKYYDSMTITGFGDCWEPRSLFPDN
jgi:hypothetical protein